jgi:hypothetical protein
MVGESVDPEIRPGGAVLVRRLNLFGNEIDRACVRVAVGRRIERVAEDVWLVSGEQEFRVRVSKPHMAFVVDSDGFELRAKILPTGESLRADETGLRCASSSNLEVTYSW